MGGGVGLSRTDPLVGGIDVPVDVVVVSADGTSVGGALVEFEAGRSSTASQPMMTSESNAQAIETDLKTRFRMS